MKDPAVGMGVGLFYILPGRFEGSSSTVRLSLKTPPSLNICEGRTQRVNGVSTAERDPRWLCVCFLL